MATTTDTITVPEIHCGHCKSSIEGALQPMEGVTDAQVDIDARTVHVTFDDATVTRDALREAIEAQGYEVGR
jgi:copper chaperone